MRKKGVIGEEVDIVEMVRANRELPHGKSRKPAVPMKIGDVSKELMVCFGDARNIEQVDSHHVLMVLGELPGEDWISAGDLAEVMGRRPADLSRAVWLLDKRGLVQAVWRHKKGLVLGAESTPARPYGFLRVRILAAGRREFDRIAPRDAILEG
jgi:hypothetical protein